MKILPALLSLACFAWLLSGLPTEASPTSPFSVDITLDTLDANPGDNHCADAGGHCSLRAAVMEANAHIGPDTILLPADTFHLTITGAGEELAGTGDLDISSNVTLQGMGPTASIVDAAALGDRVFDVLTGTTVSLSQITIRGGLVPDVSQQTGGGVQNWGTLTLTGVLITKNSVSAPVNLYGGGIGNRTTGVLALVNSQVISNDGGYNGGGIYNLGQMTVSGSQVISNTARFGGGVSNMGGLAINASQVLSNSAGENSGGIFNSGQMAMSNSTIQGNQSPANAGGLATYGIDSRLTISSSAIGDNTSAGTGGGLLAAESAVVTVTSSTLSGNHAAQDGGGVYADTASMTIIASTLTGNTAGRDGAGIYLNGGSLSLANVTLALNTASRSGGGLVNVGGALDAYNLTVAGNEANAGILGGAGGGLYQNGGTATLRNSVLAYNRRHFINFSVQDDCFGTFGTIHYSLVIGIIGCTFANDNTTGQDPLLQPLADNGGSTQTMALGPGSPALDAADPTGCASPFGGLLLTDQRGRPRHADGNRDGVARCDIGAYEVQLALFLPLLRR